MSLHQYIDDVEVTVENDPTPGPWETASHGGEMGGGGDEGAGAVVVVDPSGVLDLRGWKTYRADETACVGRESIFRGFIKGKQIKRGAEGPIGAGRVWECEIGDGHLLLGLRILEGSDCKRTSETNLERIDWLLTKLQGYGVPLYDTGHVIDSHPRPFDDADYTDETAQDVLDDISGIIGRDYFVFWDFDASGGAKWSLWYNQRAANDMASPLSISNVEGEADYSTIFPTGAAADSDDASLSRQPDEIYSREIVKFRNGKATRTRPATAAGFIERDHFTDNSRIGLLSTAIAAGDSFLEAHSAEKDTITVPVRLPANKVNLAIAGETIDLHLEHQPGYEADFVTTRISKRTVSKPTIDAFYDVVLECTLAAPAARGGSGSDGFPHPPPSALSIIQQSVGLSTRTLAADPTDGDALVLVASKRSSAPTWESILGYTDSGEGPVSQGAADYVLGGYKTAASDSATMITTSLDEADGWYEISAGATLTDHASAHGTGYSAATAAVTIPTGGIAFLVAGIGTGGGFDAGAGYSGAWSVAGWVEDFDSKVADGHPASLIAHRLNSTSADVTVTPSASFLNDGAGPWPWQMIVMVFGPSGTSDPVPSGRAFGPVSPVETPDGTIATFTLPAGYEFADRSIRVLVNRLDQTAAVTSYDGAARTFALAFMPKTGWLIEVYGLGR